MFFLFFLVLLANVWIWKIFEFSLLTGILILLSSVLLFLFFKVSKKILLIISLILLFLAALKTPNYLTVNLQYDNQEKILMIQRLKEYPPITVLPLAHWLEERPETIAVYKITQNLSEVIDPNLYFFANHPRERIGFSEIEKFPYILLPFLIYGIFKLITLKKRQLFIFLAFPIGFYAIFGLRNSIDPYLLFPFIAISIYVGIKESALLLSDKSKTKLLIVLLVIWALVLTQNIIYAIH